MVNFSNYLYENLMIDRELKVLLASPINKWSSLLKVDCNFDNFEVKAYSDTDFKEEDNDCDLIICKNSEKYSKETLDKLTSFGLSSSLTTQKRVTIGYIFDDTSSTKSNYDILYIISFKGYFETTDKMFLEKDKDMVEVCAQVLMIHDDLERQKTKKIGRKID